MSRLSRSKLAHYVAGRITAGDGEMAVKELAAYLIETRRVREAGLVVRAVYEELERAGTVVADVTSIGTLDEAVQRELAVLIGAQELIVNQTIEPAVLGGVLVRTPSRVLDATIRRRLGKLRERKV